MEREKDFLPSGQRNALKRFIPDKGIQGNPSFFPWKNLAGLGPIWPGLAKFGFGFDNRTERICKLSRVQAEQPLSSPCADPYMYLAVREGGYGDKWAS